MGCGMVLELEGAEGPLANWSLEVVIEVIDQIRGKAAASLQPWQRS